MVPSDRGRRVRTPRDVSHTDDGKKQMNANDYPARKEPALDQAPMRQSSEDGSRHRVAEIHEGANEIDKRGIARPLFGLDITGAMR